jgi:hypothetical protein
MNKSRNETMNARMLMESRHVATEDEQEQERDHERENVNGESIEADK